MTKGKPRERKLRPREQQAIDAQKLFAQLTKDGSIWEHASCADTQFPDAWFPDNNGKMTRDEYELVRMAIRICDGCPVREECLTVGMQDEDIRFGVWGGLLAGERLAIRHKTTGYPLGKLDRLAVAGAKATRKKLDNPITDEAHKYGRSDK
jgi:hypothetical protein